MNRKSIQNAVRKLIKHRLFFISSWETNKKKKKQCKEPPSKYVKNGQKASLFSALLINGNRQKLDFCSTYRA